LQAVNEDMRMAVEAPVRSEASVARRAPFAGVLDVAGDYLALLKPKIILLLLVTELGAMVVAAGGWPAPGVLLGALIGGAMAAGGACGA
jgi:protoheme IX farnesyltransferase